MRTVPKLRYYEEPVFYREYKSTNGRYYVRLYYSDESTRRIARARFVMEQHLRRRLRPNEDVHHINDIKDDDRLENLQLMSRPEHMRLHCPITHPLLSEEIPCSYCGKILNLIGWRLRNHKQRSKVAGYTGPFCDKIHSGLFRYNGSII
jgi:hypothetical protein